MNSKVVKPQISTFLSSSMFLQEIHKLREVIGNEKYMKNSYGQTLTVTQYKWKTGERWISSSEHWLLFHSIQIWRPPLALFGTRHAHGAQTGMQTKQSYTHKINKIELDYYTPLMGILWYSKYSTVLIITTQVFLIRSIIINFICYIIATFTFLCLKYKNINIGFTIFIWCLCFYYPY